ncbi:transglycosylase SLT domain-containing protein [Pseudomonas typographi]|uniref:transglycosylase SLT domain-containing protein n=1 Tax=Pseudomonas typographi TaxID=2715964 RepID=UPI00168314DD|nr:transglycosylase SLT domain-containing protein [Pseudomonas typographi]MBD1588719.1 transglycosylase SLT domain-containing protein [Pseudomonas typographi]
MKRPLLLIVLCMAAWLPAGAQARTGGPQQVAHSAKARDLPEIRASHVLRVLVNQSRNSSGTVSGRSIGEEEVRLKAFERYLASPAGGGQAIRFKVIPKAKEQLLGALLRGEGDLVAPGEAMEEPTPLAAVAGSAPTVGRAPLVLVRARGARQFSRPEQLAGQLLVLPAGSAAGQAVAALNERLERRHLAPVRIEWVDPSLAVEDVLEMVEAKVYPMTLVEQPIAERWAKVMPQLQVDRQLAFAPAAGMRWYTRSEATQLQASVDGFLRDYRPPADQDKTFAAAYAQLYKIQNPMARRERERLEGLRPVLQRNAQQQGLDWLDLAALAYKESALDPDARGASGATGLLQITPSAAARVGVGGIHDVDNNVKAGARYLAMIKRKFFASRHLAERERMAFTLAAYNLGPERVQALRAEARRRGLNPNQWFFQVERVAQEQVGMAPVSYVNAVNKYFLAYDRERERLEPQGGRVAYR